MINSWVQTILYVKNTGCLKVVVSNGKQGQGQLIIYEYSKQPQS